MADLPVFLASDSAFDAWTNADPASWAVTADQANSPVDDTLTADLAQTLNVGGTAQVYITKGVSGFTSGQLYSWVIYAKPYPGGGMKKMWIYSRSLDGDANSIFTLTGDGEADANTHPYAAIQNVGDGWYKCWIHHSSVTDLSGAVRIYGYDLSGNPSLDGVGGLYLSNFEIFTGELFPDTAGGRTGPGLSFGSMGKLGT